MKSSEWRRSDCNCGPDQRLTRSEVVPVRKRIDRTGASARVKKSKT